MPKRLLEHGRAELLLRRHSVLLPSACSLHPGRWQPAALRWQPAGHHCTAPSGTAPSCLQGDDEMVLLPALECNACATLQMRSLGYMGSFLLQYVSAQVCPTRAGQGRAGQGRAGQGEPGGTGRAVRTNACRLLGKQEAFARSPYTPLPAATLQALRYQLHTHTAPPAARRILELACDPRSQHSSGGLGTLRGRPLHLLTGACSIAVGGGPSSRCTRCAVHARCSHAPARRRPLCVWGGAAWRQRAGCQDAVPRCAWRCPCPAHACPCACHHQSSRRVPALATTRPFPQTWCPSTLGSGRRWRACAAGWASSTAPLEPVGAAS